MGGVGLGRGLGGGLGGARASDGGLGGGAGGNGLGGGGLAEAVEDTLMMHGPMYGSCESSDAWSSRAF